MMSQTATRAGATVATEPQIRPHDLHTITAEEIISRAEIQPDPAEAWRRGREFVVYRIPSRSEAGKQHTVTINQKDQTAYCTCTAAGFGVRCAHVKSVVWLRAYNEAYRNYQGLSLAELEDRQRDFNQMHRGELIPVRNWRTMQSAIGEIVRELTERRAA